MSISGYKAISSILLISFSFGAYITGIKAGGLGLKGGGFRLTGGMKKSLLKLVGLVVLTGLLFGPFGHKLLPVANGLILGCWGENVSLKKSI
jgi:hypothetical protein